VKQTKSQQIVANVYVSSSVAAVGSFGVILPSISSWLLMRPVWRRKDTWLQGQVNWSPCDSDYSKQIA
jgi:hypothetical protein